MFGASAVPGANSRRPVLQREAEALHLANAEAVSRGTAESSIELERHRRSPSHHRSHPSTAASRRLNRAHCILKDR